MEGIVEVATGGTLNRGDKCPQCEGLMLYHVDANERVTESFCGNPDCILWLVEIAEE